MEHVAIDLGAKESQICVRAADGTILEEKVVATKLIPAYLKKRPFSRVILETCAEAFALADKILELKMEVRVVPATLVPTLGVGSRGVKNDRKDARVLSEVSTRIDLPSVHIPSEKSRDAKSLCSCRDALIQSRTQLINVARGWMRTRLIRIPTGKTETFPARLRKHAADQEISLPPFVNITLDAIDSLSQQLEPMDALVDTFAKTDEICRRLMTAPIGPVTAVRFVAAVDDIKRFSSAEALANYLGLTPGEHRSSERGYRTGITKAGPSPVRRNLVQCAWCVWRTRSKDPIKEWAQKIFIRSGNKPIAVVALARKLAVILFAMWRDGSEYDSHYETKRRRAQALAAR